LNHAPEPLFSHNNNSSWRIKILIFLSPWFLRYLKKCHKWNFSTLELMATSNQLRCYNNKLLLRKWDWLIKNFYSSKTLIWGSWIECSLLTN